jgi:hypothetical protein
VPGAADNAPSEVTGAGAAAATGAVVTWRPVIESGQDSIPESFNTTPITSSSRETRLRAVEALPDLYKKLLKAFDDEVTRL